jgi:hypothetical protein
MGVSNSIKKQEQAQEQAQQSQGQGADIIGLLKDVQSMLEKTSEASQADRKAMQSTLDTVAATAAEITKVQNAITANTDKVAASMQSAVSEFNEGLAGVEAQVKALKVSQNEISQAVTLKRSVREIEEEFDTATRETIQTIGADLDKQLATVQQRFRSPFEWIGKIDRKELFSKAAWLYVAGLAALVALIATVLVVVIGTRQFWQWATATAWFPIVAALLFAAPAVLSIVAVTRWLWQLIRKE